MSKQVSPVFDAVEERARRYPKWDIVMRGASICRQAARQRQEIEGFRKYRKLLRDNANLKPNINGALALLEMHPLEAEAIAFICPDFTAPNSERQKRGLAWVKKQPWAEEFLPPKFEKVRF